MPYYGAMDQKKITLRIDPAILAKVRKEAQRMRRSLTAEVNVLLELGLLGVKEVVKKPQK